MNYYLIVGEASGDLHASNLMASLKTEDPAASFRFFGGDLMQAVGGSLVKHYRDMAFMGLIPVLLNFRTILRNMQLCREDISACHPDVVILVDYPGFNLKIAKFVKKQLHIPVYYYISPKIWAWKRYRIKTIRRYIDRMFCILPFEIDFYKSFDYPVDYVGNPTVDSVASFREAFIKVPTGAGHSGNFFKINDLPPKPVIAILAGSRKAEIAQNLPAMLSAVEQFPDFQYIIAGAPGLSSDDYYRVITRASENASKKKVGVCNVKIVFGQTYQLLSVASFALVTSGTATLETALFRVPQVVCYYVTGGKIINFVFRCFFHVPYISLVNLIAGNEIVQELFGAKFSTQSIYTALLRLVHDDAYRMEMLEGYERVITMAGEPGASKRAAKLIVAEMSCKS